MKTFPIIEKLGGRQACAVIVSKARGAPISVDAVRMWCARGSIPGDALRALIGHAETARLKVIAKDLEPIEIPEPREVA